MNPIPGSVPDLDHEAALGWRRDGPRFALVTWFVATLALVLASAAAALLVTVAAVVPAAIAGERSSERFRDIAEGSIRTSASAWTTVIFSQLALLACAWLACRVLRKPARERLGLVATGLRPLEGTVLLLATAVPFALGLGAAWLVSQVSSPSEADPLGLQRMWSEGSRGASVAWILLIALLPGFVEEVFYRGFLQRGLSLRFGPVASILTSSLLFAFVHGELAWAAFVFPLGVWFGVVAWRTGSVRLTFVMHASVNGAWTAAMMILHRDPASESVLNAIAVALLGLGAVAMAWAIVLLRRSPAATNEVEPRQWFAPRVALVAALAGALFLVVVPPGAAPDAPMQSAARRAPTIDELEAGAVARATCTAIGEAGAVEFDLVPEVGTRVALPSNRVGVDEVIVTLDAEGKTVWLVYAGEHSGKGSKERPRGIVEQLAPGDPTVLCMTLSEGAPPIRARLKLEDDEETKLAAFERAATDGWAMRGRK